MTKISIGNKFMLIVFFVMLLMLLINSFVLKYYFDSYFIVSIFSIIIILYTLLILFSNKFRIFINKTKLFSYGKTYFNKEFEIKINGLMISEEHVDIIIGKIIKFLSDNKIKFDGEIKEEGENK